MGFNPIQGLKDDIKLWTALASLPQNGVPQFSSKHDKITSIIDSTGWGYALAKQEDSVGKGLEELWQKTVQHIQMAKEKAESSPEAALAFNNQMFRLIPLMESVITAERGGLKTLESTLTKLRDPLFDKNPQRYDMLSMTVDKIESVRKQIESNAGLFAAVDIPAERVNDARAATARQAEFPQAFSTYVKQCCSGVSLSDAMRYVDEGKKHIREVYSQNLDAISNVDKREKLAAVVWYLMFLAAEKGEGFTQGTFVVEDEGMKLYEYLTRRYDQNGYEGDYPYVRESSHFPELAEYPHRGLNIASDKGARIPLPANKRTVLFGKFKEGNRIFIKPEDFGTHEADETLFHAFEWVKTRPEKFGLVEAHQGAVRKEHAPKEFVRAFKEIVTYAKELGYIQPKRVTRVQQDDYSLRGYQNWSWEGIFGSPTDIDLQVEFKGIGGMREEIDKIRHALVEKYPMDSAHFFSYMALDKKISGFEERLQQTYPNDLDGRKGNEVIIRGLARKVGG